MQTSDPTPQPAAPVQTDNPPSNPPDHAPSEPTAGDANHRDDLARKLARESEAKQQLERQLAEAQQTITSLERRQKIDALLSESDAVDLEAARLLTELSVSQMDQPDVAAAVRELRRSRPYLFRHRSAPTDSAMGARVEPISDDALAAERAAATGDRRDLLNYLRLRRSR